MASLHFGILENQASKDTRYLSVYLFTEEQLLRSISEFKEFGYNPIYERKLRINGANIFSAPQISSINRTINEANVSSKELNLEELERLLEN